MPDQTELSKAIIAAADKDFSSFQDVIGTALEDRFRDKIVKLSADKANKIFNPEYVEPEKIQEPQDKEEEELGTEDEIEDEPIEHSVDDHESTPEEIEDEEQPED